MTMKRIKANDKNTAQLIFNSFLCCFGLRAGSLAMASVNVAMSVIGVWHSLHYGEIGCSYQDCTGIKVLHYIWAGMSTSCLVINIYLLVCLIKNFFKGITIWVIWNGFILVIRLTIFVLILALNVNKRSVAGNISFHVIAFFVSIYSILVFLSYYQQVTLTSFGYYKRYRYPTTRFPLKIKDEEYLEVEDEEEKRFIEEEFV